MSVLRRKESENGKERVWSWRNVGRCDPREVTNDRQHSRQTLIIEYNTNLATSIKWDFRRPNSYSLAACVCACESVSHYSHFPSFPVPILLLALITDTCRSRGSKSRDQSSEVRGMLLVFEN